MGVWIETAVPTFNELNAQMSHPSWVCGLKQLIGKLSCFHARSHPSWVCGLKLQFLVLILAKPGSHPSWVCGLKQQLYDIRFLALSHTLRGCVD